MELLVPEINHLHHHCHGHHWCHCAQRDYNVGVSHHDLKKDSHGVSRKSMAEWLCGVHGQSHQWQDKNGVHSYARAWFDQLAGPADH